MRYQLTREVGVFIPRVSKLWLPEGPARWTKASGGILQSLLDILSETECTRQPEGRVVTAHECEFFISRDRLWHRTSWTSSPVEAALFDVELDHMLRRLWLQMDQPDEQLLITTRRGHYAAALSPTEESYASDGLGLLSERLDTILQDASFHRRVLLPYLAVRRASISTLAFRPESERAMALARSDGVEHVEEIVCADCIEPCLALLRLQSASGHTPSVLNITVSDDYPFGRLTAATLAQMTIVFMTAAVGLLDDVDLAFTSPIEAIKGFAAAPFEYQAILEDGRSLTAMQILEEFVDRMAQFLNDPGEAAELLGHVVQAVAMSSSWI